MPKLQHIHHTPIPIHLTSNRFKQIHVFMHSRRQLKQYASQFFLQNFGCLVEAGGCLLGVVEFVGMRDLPVSF
jgi:hypothetical protein